MTIAAGCDAAGPAVAAAAAPDDDLSAAVHATYSHRVYNKLGIKSMLSIQLSEVEFSVHAAQVLCPLTSGCQIYNQEVRISFHVTCCPSKLQSETVIFQWQSHIG